MRALALAASLAALFRVADARADGLGFVYVTSNVGQASGGHAALVADGTVYHLQNGDAGLLLLVRDGWSAFRLVYAELENRPLAVAVLDVAPEVTERVQRAFARLYVEQELALARRESLRQDVRWLEAFAEHRPAPELRGAGLVSPEEAGDPDAAWLRAVVHSRAGDESLTRVTVEAERAIAENSRAPDPNRLEALREALSLREAARALGGAFGLDSHALAALPVELDEPLTPAERAGLEALSTHLEEAIGELVLSARPDRGYALLLAQARYLAARRSLATNHLVLLDAFAGAERAEVAADDVADDVRAKRREQAGALLRTGRAQVLATARIDEASFNLLEEAAGIVARDGRADAAGPLSELGLRKLPARGRSLESPPLRGDLTAALAAARARLREQDARLQERWAYDLVTRNCITELARTADGAFVTPDEVTRALGAAASPEDERFGFIPFVFFERVRERMRVSRVVDIPSHRGEELERVLRESPGVATRLRESTAYTSSIYQPLMRDSAFLLFTDDVFWRRPAYGAVNLVFALGYSAFGLAAAPFDRGARVEAGLEGMMWSLPELAFMNVRKGSFDWVD
jgi:hypothetical protein